MSEALYQFSSLYQSMHELGTLRHRTRRISKAFIREQLADSDLDDSDEYACISPLSPFPEAVIPIWESGDDLLSCMSWLGQLCEKEQRRYTEVLGTDGDGHANPSRKNSMTTRLAADCSAVDTSILQRIHQGLGTRDTVPEDLLAVFRDATSHKGDVESYEAMKSLLLSWNECVSMALLEDDDARVQLGIAIEKRRSQLRRSSQGCSAQNAPHESSTELIQALTALRPEIASFQSQETLNILTMMWANVRIAIPDLDDELKLLTMKILLDEVESRSNTTNAEKLSGLARSLTVAQLEGNEAEIGRLTIKMQAFEQKIRDTGVRKVIDKIKAMRRELTQTKLKELQELTELQAAQKWAAHEELGSSVSMQRLSKACDEADSKLRRVIQHQMPELDAHVQVVQSNANGLASLSASLLMRANRAGFSLEDPSACDELAKTDIKAYVSGTVADMLDARMQAAKMLDRMDTVEKHLDVLLDAAKSKYWAYDDVLRLLQEAEPVTAKNEVDEESEFAGKYGPRRESILLMARNLNRVNQA